MRTQADIAPPGRFSITRYPPKPSRVEVRFYENVVETTLTDETSGTSRPIWEYDEYIIVIPDKPGLAEEIEADFDRWLLTAKSFHPFLIEALEFGSAFNILTGVSLDPHRNGEVIEQARDFRSKSEVAAQYLPDERAYEMASLFPLWTPNLLEHMNGTIPRLTRVRHNGYLWVNAHDIAISEHNTEPGKDPDMWSRVPNPNDKWPPWFPPEFPFTQWGYGAKATHMGERWVSEHPHNVWEPGTYGAPWRRDEE